jgi:hypothetical protein
MASLFGIGFSALLIAASAPGVGGWSWLAWIAFAPWLATLQSLRPMAATASGAVMGLAYIIPGHWQTFATGIEAAGHAGLQRDLLTLGFFACYALPFIAYGVLDGVLRRWSDALLLGSALRAAVLAALICGLWSPFAYTPVTAVVDTLGFVQWAQVGGEALLLGLLLWPSALLAELLVRRAAPAKIWRAAMVCTLVLLSLTLLGKVHIARMDAMEARGDGVRLSALAVQLNLPNRAAPGLVTRECAQLCGRTDPPRTGTSAALRAGDLAGDHRARPPWRAGLCRRASAGRHAAYSPAGAVPPTRRRWP